MPFLPTDSAIRVDAALEEKLKGASFEEIKAHLANAAVEQRLVVPDVYDNSVLIPTELASAAPRKVGKVVRFNGVAHSLIADDEAGLLAQEQAIYREAMAQPAAPAPQQPTEQPRNERGQFTTQQIVTDDEKSALSLQFQLGQITASEYLERSGAVAEYLEKQGVPLDDLKASVAEKQSERFTQSWADATEEFLHSDAGADWPGGANMQIAGRLIAENGLVDQPSAETLSRVWQHMKENNLAVENLEVTARQKIGEARCFEEIRQAGSSLFGR